MKIGAENENTEYKKTTGELKEGIISIASMLNKGGTATLYFGVKNDGTVAGQTIGDRTLRDVSEAVAIFIKPQIIPTVSIELKDGKNIVKVYAEGAEKPYSAYGRYYIRCADEDREMNPNQLGKMIRESDISDIMTKTPSYKTGLSFDTLKSLYLAKGLSINRVNFEKNLGLLTPEGGYSLLAEILSDQNDISIKVAVFAGQDKSNILKRNEYGFKSLPIAMQQVLDYMEAINDTDIVIESHGRRETKLFDFMAFKEAWQNACLHTKWTLKNPPAVYVFSDRIEIISTGGLCGITQEEFFSGVSKPVNASLQRILGQLGYVEQTGHGIPLIVSRCGTRAFSISDNFINVTIPLNRKMNNPEINRRLNSAQKRVYDYLEKDSSLTIRELVTETGYSDGYVRKILTQLKGEGFIVREGARKNGYWKVL